MLLFFASQGVDMHILTNKRIKPTLQIIDLLEWSKFFKSILSLDSSNPPHPNKSTALGRFLVDTQLPCSNCLYVGDRLDDYYSAKDNKIPFAWAKWGFEDKRTVFPADVIQLESPQDIQLIL